MNLSIQHTLTLWSCWNPVNIQMFEWVLITKKNPKWTSLEQPEPLIPPGQGCPNPGSLKESREGPRRVVERGMSDTALSWKSAAGAPVQLLKTQHGRGWMNAESDISGLC